MYMWIAQAYITISCVYVCSSTSSNLLLSKVLFTADSTFSDLRANKILNYMIEVSGKKTQINLWDNKNVQIIG